MVALGRPGAGEELLARCGLVDVERVEIPFVWEFADPQAYARALATTGPAFEAIQAVGEEGFARHALEVARQRVREGLPLRAPIAVVGYLARRPAAPRRPAAAVTFVADPEPAPAVQRLYDEDVAELGFVMNASRVWAHQPGLHDALFALLRDTVTAGGLTFRDRGILVSACAAALGDSYCSLAWGTRLAAAAGPEVAAAVLHGADDGLDAREQALARWARQVVRDPNAATAVGVQALRDAGYDDARIVAITCFVTLRIAFSSLNDALGAHPDRELAAAAPAPVRAAVTYGRPVDAGPASQDS